MSDLSFPSVALAAALGIASGVAATQLYARDSNSKLADEAIYLAASAKIMRTMMTHMDTEPLGDTDRDFVAQMIPHHQAAVEMAAALLHTGCDQQLMRLAQEIIVTQRAEIVVMARLVGRSVPTTDWAPNTSSTASLRCSPHQGAIIPSQVIDR